MICRRTPTVLLAMLLLCLSIAVPISAAASDTKNEQAIDFTIIPFDDDSTSITPVPDETGNYTLYLPADTDPAALRVRFSGACTVNGDALQNDTVTDVFSTPGEYEVTLKGKAFSFTVMQSQNLPSVFIKTESGSLDQIHADKEYKESAVITTVENGKITLKSTPLKHIKGRGNATWNVKEKKPYNIRFETKTGLLGMAEAEKWSLLANHKDDTLMKNALAYSLAREMEISSAVDSRFIDLYINGDYRGNYLLCESVMVGENRVDISDLEDANKKANPGLKLGDATLLTTENNSPDLPRILKYSDIPNDPADISGGYLLELEHFTDRFDSDEAGFSSLHGQSVAVKSPEYATKNEINYIAGIYSQMEAAIYSENGTNSAGRHYSELIDINSFVNMVLLQELTYNSDFLNSSDFIYKDAGNDLFFAGPAWDFDIAFPLEPEGEEPDRLDYWFLYSSNTSASVQYFHETIFTKLMQQESFFNAAAQRWFELSSELNESIDSHIDTYEDQIIASAVMNGMRWNLLDGDTAEEKTAAFRGLAAQLTKALNKRISVLDRGFVDPDSLKDFTQFLLDARKLHPVDLEPTWPDDEATTKNSEVEDGATIMPGIISGAVAILCMAVLVLFILRKKTHETATNKEEEPNDENKPEGSV